MYLNTFLATPKFLVLGFFIYQENKLVANIMYVQEAMRYNKLPIRLLKYVGFAFSSPSFSSIFLSHPVELQQDCIFELERFYNIRDIPILEKQVSFRGLRNLHSKK